MKSTLTVAAFAALAAICEAAPLDRIDADVLDPNAPRGIVRTFDATKLTVKGLRSARTARSGSIGWHLVRR